MEGTELDRLVRRSPDSAALLAKVCVVTARTPEAEDAVQTVTDLLAEHLGSWVCEVWLHRGGDRLELMAQSISESIPPDRRERLKAPPPRG